MIQTNYSSIDIEKNFFVTYYSTTIYKKHNAHSICNRYYYRTGRKERKKSKIKPKPIKNSEAVALVKLYKI